MDLSQITIQKPQDQVPEGKIILVGMAVDGPVCRPFTLNEYTNIDEILGEETHISVAFKQLLDAGINRENIVIYRLNGIHGQTTFNGPNKEPVLRFMTIGTSEENEEIHIKFQDNVLNILTYKVNPIPVIEDVLDSEGEEIEEDVEEQETKIEVSKTAQYRLSNYDNWNDLVNDINKDAELGIISCAVQLVQYQDEVALDKDDDTEHYFEDIDTEEYLCRNEQTDEEEHKINYWNKLENGVLGDYEDKFMTPIAQMKAELLYFTDIYFDELPEVGIAAGSLAELLSEDSSSPCFSVMNTSPIPEQMTIPDWYYQDEEGNWYDGEEQIDLDVNREINNYIFNLDTMDVQIDKHLSAMNYLQIVVGDTFYHELPFPVSPYYCATYLQTPFYNPITNKPLSNQSFGEELNKSTIANLKNSGYICIVPSIRNGFVPYFAQTFNSKENSILEGVHTRRTLSHITTDLKEILNEYIGKPHTQYSQESIQKTIDEYLTQFVENDILRFYNYEVPKISVLNPPKLIEIFIDLNFYSETEKIRSGFSIDTKEGATDEWFI